jgi:hypothetical protein
VLIQLYGDKVDGELHAVAISDWRTDENRNQTILITLLCCCSRRRGDKQRADCQQRKNQAKIPYGFVVGDTTLPAGTYEIGVADDHALNVLQIQSANGKTKILFATESIQLSSAKRDSKLVFDKVGDTYFLSRVFLGGDDSVNELPKSKRQRKLEEQGLTAATIQ